MSVAPRKPTPWESIVTTVIDSLVASLPDILRNGYTGDGIAIPAYDAVALPDIVGYDTGRKPPLCPLGTKAADTTRLSLRGACLSGLDTVASYAPLTFPVPDIELSVPLVFSEIVVNGEWETHTPCKKGQAQPVDTVHTGTFTLRFTSVQVTVDVKLDATASAATAVTVTLTDATHTWSSQPAFDPCTDVTFDPTTSGGDVTVLRVALETIAFGTLLGDPARRALEGPGLAGDLRTVINDALASVS